MIPEPRSMVVAVLRVAGACIIASGCALDFDAPFAETGHGGGSGSDGPGASNAGGAAEDASAESGNVGGGAGAGAWGGGAAGSEPDAGGDSADAGSDAVAYDGTDGQFTQTEVDCLDSLDNDGDGLVDCSDPDCQPLYRCVPEPATAFDGYFRVRTEQWDGSEPVQTLCDDGSAPARSYQGPRPALACHCACGVADEVACSLSRLSCSGTASCSTGIDVTDDVADGVCHGPSLLPSMTPRSCSVKPPVPAAVGNCVPTSAETTTPPWTRTMDACVEERVGGGGCTAGSTCVRSPPAGHGHLCIRMAGADPCPLGWDAQESTWLGAVDSRACDACGCSFDPSSATCSPTVYAFHDFLDCGGPSVALDSMTCVDVAGMSDYFTWSVRLVSAPVPTTAGACTPFGGEPTGSVNPFDPVTYCCQQP